MKPKFNYYENRIIQVLRLSVRLLNTKEIAYYAKIDWATANKYLLILKKKRIVKEIKIGISKCWKLNI